MSATDTLTKTIEITFLLPNDEQKRIEVQANTQLAAIDIACHQEYGYGPISATYSGVSNLWYVRFPADGGPIQNQQVSVFVTYIMGGA